MRVLAHHAVGGLAWKSSCLVPVYLYFRRLPPRKCINLDRIILQGTCRRVVAPTGVSTLLKTREFGINFTPHHRKSVEMQLPESHILVHIEILGIAGRISRRKTSKDYSIDYFTGPEFLSEYREEEPYTAAEAAVVISQRVADQSRHVWGNARVVHWELEADNQEAEFRVSCILFDTSKAL